ncbi:hypothetical protein TRIUR3_09697 [Triticum urartu]|uniref:Calcium-transporting P-type ATPase N-terminal autoinhibitory domain-containing protein n=1 Tax=Triticum urartu TaxID=4572 RepID=M7YZM0_TRIUA|nr:hypothetical protein TRIUR3_09697 [Triticum urartu]
MEGGGSSWASMEGYLNEYFHIPAKNPPSDARLRWRRAVGLVVRNRPRRFHQLSGPGAIAPPPSQPPPTDRRGPKEASQANAARMEA